MGRPIAEAYIADGAYVSVNELGELVIYTTNGIRRTNEVVFERQPARMLIRFIEAHVDELVG